MIEKQRKKDHIKTIILLMKGIIYETIIILVKELGLAFLPIFVIGLICMFSGNTYSSLTMYYDIYIAFVTLSAGNLIYLFCECEGNDKDIKITLSFVSVTTLVISLIAFVIISLNDMQIAVISINQSYMPIAVSVSIGISLVEILKVHNSIKGRQKSG